MGTLAASTQCWWMAQALRSQSRWWLVVSSDEMSSCASRSRTSVTDRRLIQTCQPRHTTWKNFASSVERILLWSRWQQNAAGPIKRPSSSTITFLHNITRSVASCYKSHRLSTSLRPPNYVALHTTIMRCFKIRPYFTWNFHQLSSVTSSISDDPLTQFTLKPFLRCKQACDANASKRARPLIGASNLRPYICNNNALCQPAITFR